MATSDDTRDDRISFTLDEFVAKLRDYVATRDYGKASSDGSDDCALVVTDAGLDLCCTVDTDSGLEVVCTDVLTILKAE